MKKLRVLLTCASAAAMLCASVTLIINGANIYIFIFAPLGMVLSVLAYIIEKREIAARRREMVLLPITQPVSESEWIEAMHQDARAIATHFGIPPLLVGEVEIEHNVYKMPEEWNAFVERLRSDN